MAAIDADTAAFLAAIRGTNYAAARQRLRRDQDVNVRGMAGVTALHIAAECGHLGKVQTLVKDRGDATATDDHGRTPLMAAQLHLHTHVATYLIQHTQLVCALASHLGQKPTPNQINGAMFMQRWRGFRDQVYERVEVGGAKLIQAARMGDLTAVRCLVERDEVHVDSVDQSTQETAFSAALAGGWLFVCKYLLAKGAHAYAPCVMNGETQSALRTAVMQGDTKFVWRLLADEVVHLNSTRYDPKTCALSEAVHRGANEMIDVLLEGGVQFNWFNSRHSFHKPVYDAVSAPHLTADSKSVWLRLNFACWRQDLDRIKQLCATYVELQDRELMATHGAYALYLAVYQQNEEIVTELLARGAKINSPMVGGATAMVAAAYANSVRMLRFLLQRGGDASVVHSSLLQETGFDQSLLCSAVYAGAMDCAHMLFPLETRPEQRDQAMILAVQRDEEEFVRLLLDEALPSTQLIFKLCVRRSRTPMMLDLILTRCCAERYSIHSLIRIVQFRCSHAEPDELAVYVDHGMDANALLGSEFAMRSGFGGKADVIKLLKACGTWCS